MLDTKAIIQEMGLRTNDETNRVTVNLIGISDDELTQLYDYLAPFGQRCDVTTQRLRVKATTDLVALQDVK